MASVLSTICACDALISLAESTAGLESCAFVIQFGFFCNTSDPFTLGGGGDSQLQTCQLCFPSHYDTDAMTTRNGDTHAFPNTDYEKWDMSASIKTSVYRQPDGHIDHWA
ncbi:hypothetical protein ACTXT7_016396 [Hymenolepis weldensis]